MVVIGSFTGTPRRLMGIEPSTGIDLLVRTQSPDKRPASRLLLYSTYYCAPTISTSTINSRNQSWNTNPRINLRERGLIKFINKKKIESVIYYSWKSKRTPIRKNFHRNEQRKL